MHCHSILFVSLTFDSHRPVRYFNFYSFYYTCWRFFFLKMYKLVYLSLLGLAVAAPAPQRNRGGQQKQTAFQQAMKIPMGISQAQDGGMILDDMVMVKYVPLIARISGL